MLKVNSFEQEIKCVFVKIVENFHQKIYKLSVLKKNQNKLWSKWTDYQSNKKIKPFCNILVAINHLAWRYLMDDKRTRLSTTFGLMTNDSALNLSSLVNFQNNITSCMFNGRLLFSSSDTEGSSTKASGDVTAKLEMTVRASAVPKLLQDLGRYQEIVLELLNYDFQLKSELVGLIPRLFCGALLHDSITLLIITCEVYSRHSSVDIHSESTEFSVPGESSGYKNRMSCNTYEKSDGEAAKLKLITGTKTFNLLITCSAEISTEPKINIGPGVQFSHGSITDTNSKIYLMKSKVEEFLKKFETFKLNPLHINISSLRQVTSSFNK